MLEFVTGDFFDYPAEIRVNTVNCVGVMGAGVALEFKRRYPEMFKAYVKACKKNEIAPGVPQVYDDSDLFHRCVIINFPTKTHWRMPSKYEYIESGLVWLREYLSKCDADCTVTLPALGCGHGGLNWDQVKAMITQYLGDLACRIYVFPPASSNRQVHAESFTEELKQCGAVMVTSAEEDYLSKTGEEQPFYFKGARENLRRKKIHLLISKSAQGDVFTREFEALCAILRELGEAEVSLLLSISTVSDKTWALKLCESGFHVIAFANEGILKVAQVQEYAAYPDRLCVVSYLAPDSTYKRETMNNNDRAAKSADAVLLCNSDLEDIKAHSTYVMPYLTMGTPGFYVRYWNGRIEAFAGQGIEPIGMDLKTGRPHVDRLRECIGVVREENV